MAVRWIVSLLTLLASMAPAHADPAEPPVTSAPSFDPELMPALESFDRVNSAIRRNLGQGLWSFCRDPNVSEGAKRIFQRITGLTAEPCVPLNEELNRPKIHLAEDTDQLKTIFLAWAAPIAVYLHEKTGLPASVIIAQAAVETGWGVSPVFRRINNGFGHSCFRRRRTKTFRMLLGARSIQFTAKCNYPRPSSEGAFYLSFDNPLHSVYAYVYNLLYNPATSDFYGNLRDVIEKAHPLPARPADVIKSLHAYAADDDYQEKLLQMIEYNDLERYDKLESCL